MANSSFDPASRHAAVKGLMRQFSNYGANEVGGISRLALNAADKQARDFLCEWLRDNGFETRVDAVGNIFGVLSLGEVGTGKSFFCGSHLDSQPNGGKFDGTLGVVCACVAALLLQNRVELGELETDFDNFVVVCWTGEEGARFRPAMLGSQVFTRDLSIEQAYAACDGEGIRFKDALEAIGYAGVDDVPMPTRYFELHIEQGPTLEEEQYPIGLVQQCWGALKYTIEIKGRPDHTGPAPMQTRRDALLAAAYVIVRVNEIAQGSKAPLHSSVGRIESSPNSPNTVTDYVRLFVEIRTGTETQLSEANEKLLAALGDAEVQTGCELAITQQDKRDVVHFDEFGLDVVAEAFAQSDIRYKKMPTIAGHDAIALQSVCPSNLMFVPSQNGVSHTPQEFTCDEDIEAGFDGMIEALSALMAVRLQQDPTGAIHA